MHKINQQVEMIQKKYCINFKNSIKVMTVLYEAIDNANFSNFSLTINEYLKLV